MDKALAAIQDLLGRYTRALQRASGVVPRTVRRDEAKAIFDAVEKLHTAVRNSSDSREAGCSSNSVSYRASQMEVGRYLYMSTRASLRGAARRSFELTQSAVAPGGSARSGNEDVFNHLAFIWQTYTGNKFVATRKRSVKNQNLNAQLRFFNEVFAAAKISHPSAKTRSYLMGQARKAIGTSTKRGRKDAS